MPRTTATKTARTSLLAAMGGVPASPSVPQQLAPVVATTPVATPVVTPAVVAAPRAVAVTPVAAVVAAKLTAPVVAGGPPSNAKLSGTMLATLRALHAAGTAITHTQVACATGRNKGNQLRPLLALGYTSTHALPGTRGYVYAITPAGVAALPATA